MKAVNLILILVLNSFLFAQNYTSYFTGNSTDSQVYPYGGVCLMGGASENDEAMKWFLQQSNGGDVLILRTSGSNGYNNYFYSQLGVSLNSVETIVCHNQQASYDTYVQEKIKKAEAIWFAGGDQWTYISYWRNTPVDSLINQGIAERNIVIGGTSAGMAIQGGYYFSAQNGTVTSPTALSNPYSSAVTVSGEPFIKNAKLANVITDTHYDNPDRRGRHIVFLARLMKDQQLFAKGIACDEYTAVCIPPSGICRIYGEYPQYDENAYFIQPNCDLGFWSPEVCQANTPLTWNRDGQALKVYRAKGTMTGSQTFDLNTWNSGEGGVWEHWSVVNGVLNTGSATAPSCSQGNVQDNSMIELQIYPNPAQEIIHLRSPQSIENVELYSLDGRCVELTKLDDVRYQINNAVSGVYLIKVITGGEERILKLKISND